MRFTTKCFRTDWDWGKFLRQRNQLPHECLFCISLIGIIMKCLCMLLLWKFKNHEIYPLDYHFARLALVKEFLSVESASKRVEARVYSPAGKLPRISCPTHIDKPNSRPFNAARESFGVDLRPRSNCHSIGEDPFFPEGYPT